MPITITLDELPAAYAAAREAASSSARLAESSDGVCRYCGQAWRPAAIARNDGHARCIVTPEFQSAVGALWWGSPALTRATIAARLGVSLGTVSAWTDPRRMERAA